MKKVIFLSLVFFCVFCTSVFANDYKEIQVNLVVEESDNLWDVSFDSEEVVENTLDQYVAYNQMSEFQMSNLGGMQIFKFMPNGAGVVSVNFKRDISNSSPFAETEIKYVFEVDEYKNIKLVSCFKDGIEILFGDITGDGRVDAGDCSYLLSYILNKDNMNYTSVETDTYIENSSYSVYTKADDIFTAIADYNNDKVINATDVSLIMSRVLNKDNFSKREYIF